MITDGVPNGDALLTWNDDLEIAIYRKMLRLVCRKCKGVSSTYIRVNITQGKQDNNLPLLLSRSSGPCHTLEQTIGLTSFVVVTSCCHGTLVIFSRLIRSSVLRLYKRR